MTTIEQIREQKIPWTGGMVVFDWIATLMGAPLLAYLLYGTTDPWLLMFVVLIVISIPLHVVTDTPTVTNYYLGLSDHPQRSKPE